MIHICTGPKTLDAHGSTFSITHLGISMSFFFSGFSSGEGPLQEVKVCKTEDCQAGLPWSVLVVMHMSDPTSW